MGCDKIEDILYKAHNEGIRDKVLKVSGDLKGSYYTLGDKLEAAYRIVKENEKTNYGRKRRNI